MSVARRPLIRQHGLNGLAAAVEQQPRLWLPQHAGGGAWVLWLEVLNTWAAAAGLFFSIVVSLRLGGLGWLVWMLVLGALATWATWALVQKRQRKKQQGWEVHFEQRKLTPVGLHGHSVITLGPDYSLGCYVGGDGEEAAWQLELRHARRGPVAALALIHANSGKPEEMATLDHFVSRLAQRLEIRRSGAPLPGLPRSAKPDPA
ncbi:hypothetical protein [Acidovorax sp. 106]|uniref:hypothetical protein n=1 Tax=Acidovorax sp. 106 TaxID=2135637 RepID=UPI0011C3E0D9|nr:hypothetical protein [Acidovorax sp. 106]